MHKKDNLSKQSAGKGHWQPELATESEEAIRADRADCAGATANALQLIQVMKGLQERTKGAAEQTAKAGTSMSDEV